MNRSRLLTVGPAFIRSMGLLLWLVLSLPSAALAQDWAVSPATAAVANDPEIARRNPGMVASHAAKGLFIDTDFWVENGEDLEAKFNAWLAR